MFHDNIIIFTFRLITPAVSFALCYFSITKSTKNIFDIYRISVSLIISLVIYASYDVLYIFISTISVSILSFIPRLLDGPHAGEIMESVSLLSTSIFIWVILFILGNYGDSALN